MSWIEEFNNIFFLSESKAFSLFLVSVFYFCDCHNFNNFCLIFFQSRYSLDLLFALTQIWLTFFRTMVSLESSWNGWNPNETTLSMWTVKEHVIMKNKKNFKRIYENVGKNENANYDIHNRNYQQKETENKTKMLIRNNRNDRSMLSAHLIFPSTNFVQSVNKNK